MRSQRDRDTVTLDIFTTLLIFVLVLAAGAVPLFLVDRFVWDGATQMLSTMVVAGASAVALSYLWRHRRP